MNHLIFLKSFSPGLFAIALLLAAVTALAEHHEIPNLKGVWKGTNYTLSDLKGFKQWEKTVHITEQQDRRFRGHFTYDEGRKDFFGIIFNNNKDMLWVSSTSRGYSPGRLLNNDSMDVCYVESGLEATVGCTLFKRQK